MIRWIESRIVSYPSMYSPSDLQPILTCCTKLSLIKLVMIVLFPTPSTIPHLSRSHNTERKPISTRGSTTTVRLHGSLFKVESGGRTIPDHQDSDCIPPWHFCISSLFGFRASVLGVVLGLEESCGTSRERIVARRPNLCPGLESRSFRSDVSLTAYEWSCGRIQE